MSSNNYGEIVEGADIGAWLGKCDWTRRYHVLSVDKTGIPDLMEVQMAETVSGYEVRDRIRRSESMEAINWGNGHFGLGLYDGQELHYILVEEEL